VNDVPGGVVLRGLGEAIVAGWLAPAPVPERVVIAPPIRRTAWPPEPEIRPPTFAWTNVRLARAPPLDA
jgi:hypothetical protein